MTSEERTRLRLAYYGSALALAFGVVGFGLALLGWLR